MHTTKAQQILASHLVRLMLAGDDAFEDADSNGITSPGAGMGHSLRDANGNLVGEWSCRP